MNLKDSFLISLLLYAIGLILFYNLNSKQEDTNKIVIQKGSTGILSFVFANNAEGMSQSPQTNRTSSVEGAVSEEINKIRNKISYPLQALEDGLESECEWSIVIDAKQKASQVKTIRPCKYKIFDDEFHRVIQDWNFTLPENTVLQIPVSFKIQ
jgi:outer membrane biosynthesis protein TonB